MRFLKPIGFLLILITCEIQATAWNRVGHMESAAIAYREMSPAMRSRIFPILGQHPNYPVWRQDYESLRPSLPNSVDIGMYIFMRASVWPDDIRGTSSSFDKPKWHLMSYPLRAPSFPLEPPLDAGENLLYGISETERIITNPQSDPIIRAVSLSYLIHLVADIHQPLHCVTLIDQKFPNGDKGGTTFYVRSGPYVGRLHSFWDSLGGLDHNVTEIVEAVVRIEQEYSRAGLNELLTEIGPDQWALESRDIAIRDVYLNGNLKGAASPNSAHALPRSYQATARLVTYRRIALSGYRLSDLLNQLLKVKK
jgi:S1/P1 nuclease